MVKIVRIFTGILVWIGLLGGFSWSVNRQLASYGELRERVAPELWTYTTGRRQSAELQFDRPVTVAVGDPVFIIHSPDSVEQVGHVVRVIDPETDAESEKSRVATAEVKFYPGAPPIHDDIRITYYNTYQMDDMEWAMQTFLPPEKRAQIAQMLAEAFEEHREEILAELRPIVQESLREALEVINSDLQVAFNRHRRDFEKLSQRYQRDLMQKEVTPLVKEEIWPIVQKRAEPVAQEVGLEIWERVSLWRFGWRALYDFAPLPERNRLEREWQRFLKKEAFPILERHTDDFVMVVQQSLNEASRNPKVQAAARRSLQRVIQDKEMHEIALKIMREVIIDNPRLRKVMEKHWTGPKARRAFQLAAERLEPTVREIGDLLFGTRSEGISPEFQRLLRNQILVKDKRWFVVENVESVSAGPTPTVKTREPLQLTVQRGRDVPDVNPFIPDKPPARP